MIRYRKTITSLAVFACAMYMVWAYLMPVEIIGIYQYRNSTDILIKNPPITDGGKIKWWENNKISFKKNNVPKPNQDGTYYINIWDFGDGYKKEDKYDRLCFDDINYEKKCIDKKKHMTIYKFKRGSPIFSIDGKTYAISGNGEIVKEK